MTTLNGSYREFTLDNGLHVMLQNTPTQTISGKLRVHFGALNERKGEEGLAHFLEHNLMTGGSEKYSPEETDEIRRTFGYYNATTSLSKTQFPVDMLSEDLELYLDFVSDITFNPRLDETRFEEERQRVLRETSDSKSRPGFKDAEKYNEKFFGKNSPHTYFILGKEEVVRAVTPKEMKEFQKRGYGASNMDLILVGNLPSNVEELVSTNFGNKSKGKNTKFEFQKNPNLEDKTLIHTRAPELYNQDNPSESTAELNISIVAPAEEEKEAYNFTMLNAILGVGSNSKLFTSVSQRKGLAYEIGSSYIDYDNAGYCVVGCKIQSTKADEGIDAIFDEMKKLRETSVDEQELKIITRQTKYEIAKAFEFNKGHINAIETKYDKNITPEEYLSKIDAVTPDDVQRVAQKYFPENREDGKYVLMLRDPLRN